MQTTKKVKRTIDDEVDRLIDEMKDMKPETPEYEAKVKHVETLCRARSFKASKPVSTDTIIAAATNILGILLIINYENLHVVSTKALGFIAKGRV